MIPQRFLTLAVVALPLLILAFAVLMGGYAVATVADDQGGATALWWVAMVCLMLITIDVLALVMALGINQIHQAEDEEMSRRDRDEPRK